MKVRNPTSLGEVRGPGVVPAHANFPELEEFRVVEISFQMVSDSHGVVGYADMDPGGVGTLHHLFGEGDRYDARLDSGLRDLVVGDFGIFLESENDRAIVTARW